MLFYSVRKKTACYQIMVNFPNYYNVMILCDPNLCPTRKLKKLMPYYKINYIETNIFNLRITWKTDEEILCTINRQKDIFSPIFYI